MRSLTFLLHPKSAMGRLSTHNLRRSNVALAMIDPTPVDASIALGTSIVAPNFADITLALNAITTSVDAWSVNGDTLASPDVASNLFAVSIFPYLLLLFFLSRSQTNTPKLGNFGFQFLLVFVAATIPAGIYAKVNYQDILANVDWLHGLAESFLTVTNLLIITGFRNAKKDAFVTQQTDVISDLRSSANYFIRDNATAVMVALASIIFILVRHPFEHIEPSNALSFPTWVIHTSSVLEWLLAMRTIRQFAYISGNTRWKEMSYAMIPSHASGLCACTYHLFYNSPSLIWLVSLQAALTTLGNTSMAIAAFRIFQEGGNSDSTSLATNKRSSTMPILEPSDSIFYLSLAAKSLVVAAVVKFGELYWNVPFEPSTLAALSLIGLPVALNLLVQINDNRKLRSEFEGNT